jgi:hypothetical protein
MSKNGGSEERFIYSLLLLRKQDELWRQNVDDVEELAKVVASRSQRSSKRALCRAALAA